MLGGRASTNVKRLNPLLEHPLLGGLPYHDLTHPTREGLVRYLERRKRNAKRLALAYPVLATLICIAIVAFPEERTPALWFLMLFCIARYVERSKRSEKWTMTIEQIDAQIAAWKQYKEDAPA